MRKLDFDTQWVQYNPFFSCSTPTPDNIKKYKKIKNKKY